MRQANKVNIHMFECRTFDDMPITSHCLVSLQLYVCYRLFLLLYYFQEQPFACRHIYFTKNDMNEAEFRVLPSCLQPLTGKYTSFQTPRYNCLLVITVNSEAESGSHVTANCKNLQELHILSITKHNLRTLYYSSVAPPTNLQVLCWKYEVWVI
jgi:hypothetical protein